MFLKLCLIVNGRNGDLLQKAEILSFLKKKKAKPASPELNLSCEFSKYRLGREWGTLQTIEATLLLRLTLSPPAAQLLFTV